MKKLDTTILATLLLNSFATVSAFELSGTAATSVSNLVVGDSTFVIVDTSGNDSLTSSSFTPGLTLTSGSSFGDYYVAAYNPVAGGFGTSVPGNAFFNIGDGATAADDYFYVVAFGTQSGDGITLSTSDTFGLLSASDWRLPTANNISWDYGADLTQFGSVDGASFTVVPEPSSYGALAGLLALGWVMVRRRS
jgi:hypothetical protein